MTVDPMTAAREDGWLRLHAPWAGECDAWDLLARNASRSGPARLVLAASAPQAGLAPRLVVDVPLAHPTVSPDPRGPAPEWPRLITGAGWTLAPRTDGRLDVELDTPGHCARARVADREDGVCLSVEVARPGGVSPLAREAMARFALVLTGCLRMVRATTGGDHGILELEVWLAAPPSASELDLALAALSVGYRLAARELRALTDDTLAAMYLEHLTTAKEITTCDSMTAPAFSCSM